MSTAIEFLPGRSRRGSPSHVVLGLECGRRFHPATLGPASDWQKLDRIGCLLQTPG